LKEGEQWGSGYPRYVVWI